MDRLVGRGILAAVVFLLAGFALFFLLKKLIKTIVKTIPTTNNIPKQTIFPPKPKTSIIHYKPELINKKGEDKPRLKFQIMK